ncbi:MAG: hypothetical protein J6U64_02200 [Alphaproteobacteria bacterium]|nr:hypothetical protein [Alphaproteobacteria bacterium]
MNKFLKFALNLCVVALVVGICFWADAAQASGVFDELSNKASNTFSGVRKVVFVLGAFTLVAIAVGAIFGKINWKWFISLLVALVILAVAGMIINYFVQADTISGDNVLN